MVDWDQPLGRPRTLTFGQYIYERGVPDPGSEHGILSPSGSVSDRAKTATMTRRESEWAAYGQAQRDYHAEIDAGTIVDPSGQHRSLMPERIAEMRRAIEHERSAIANLERLGMGKRGTVKPKYLKAIEERRAEIARIEMEIRKMGG